MGFGLVRGFAALLGASSFGIAPSTNRRAG
jgi:hypothetical protein